MDEILIEQLGPKDGDVLATVPQGVFDNRIIPEQAQAFLASDMHYIVVAMARGDVIGMASGVRMLHPDKHPAFFISEVGVHDDYLRRGIAKRMCEMLMQAAQDAGAKGIWLATEDDNLPARALYKSLAARETKGIVVYDWDGIMDAP